MKLLWTFGDGTTSKEFSPIHRYKMPGVYTVTLEYDPDPGDTALITWSPGAVYGNCVYGEFPYKGDNDVQIDFVGSPTIGNTGIFVEFIITSWPAIYSKQIKIKYIYIFGWNYDLGGFNVSITDKCLRFAIPQSKRQGIGWSVYDDVNEGERNYGWPYPEAVVGCCNIIDNSNERRHLVRDARTFRIYEVGKNDQWQDAEDEYSGVEMESEITWRENEPPVGASAVMEHLQSHLDLKPWFKNRRNTNGYNADGYRDGHEADVYCKIDSTDDVEAITKVVPDRGQLTFDRHFQSEALQMGCKIRTAPWRLVRGQQWYTTLDRGAVPAKKTMSESDWAMELSSPLFWVGRNIENPMLDLASGETTTGTYLAATIGPDGKSRSAIQWGAGAGWQLSGVDEFSGNFTAMLWIKSVSGDVDLLTLSGNSLAITLDNTGGDYAIDYVDSGNSVSIDVDDDFSSWKHLAVVRSNDNIIVYLNGALVNTAVLSNSTLAYSGNLVCCAGQCIASDPRILPRAVSADAIEYLYNDMIQNNGNATCPVY